ncbi:Eukaryotic translation initiation factor 4 gamma 1 [Eumeta japonica]|uniref:Eukaryotic translation initiation factor 4 gamma 1 n=1 Tax=Eumeta variegata TaxID=151549 RepID=A0A4C1T2Y2_EUMVA|nr:Eukaryotic translation initiation factor 4 gamma 1 [Eumeta japonica]
MNSGLQSLSVKVRALDKFDFQPTSWDNWKKRFVRYLRLTGNENLNDVSKIDLLLYSMGQQAEQLIKNLNVSENKEYNEVLQAIDNYFNIKRNIVFERFKFNNRIQRDTEDIDDFIKDLQVLVDMCEYGDLRDELLRDRIIVGLTDKHVTKRLLQIPDLTLKETIRMLVRAEEQDETKCLWMDDSTFNEKEKENEYGHLAKEQSIVVSGTSVNEIENVGKHVKCDIVIEIFKVLLDQLNGRNSQIMLLYIKNKIKKLELNSQSRLEEVANLVYEKALTSSESASICAKLCRHLVSFAQETPVTDKFNFRTFIIQKCQTEFISQDNNGDDNLVSFEMELVESNVPAYGNPIAMKMIKIPVNPRTTCRKSKI